MAEIRPRFFQRANARLAVLGTLFLAGCTLLSDFSGLTDGGGGDGGSGAAGGSGEGGSGTPCRALVCDDFEGSALDSLWIPNAVNSTIEIDSSRAHSGNNAMHITMSPSSTWGGGGGKSSYANGFIADPTTVPAGPGTRFVRAYYFIDAASVGTFYPLVGFSLGKSPFSAVYLRVAADGSLELFNNAGPAETVTPLATVSMLGAWRCVELQVTFGNALLPKPGEVRIWVDEEEVPGLPAEQQTQPDDMLSWLLYLSLGPLVYSPGAVTPTIEVWVDDLVIDDKRIGCE